MADKSFLEQISYFPLLEKLFLLECQTLHRITILSDKLKKLSLVRCHKLKEANIDAPNLLSFEYTGAELPFSSINASRLQEVKLHLKSQKQKFHSIEVQKFVQGFDAKGFNLFLASKQDVNVYEDLRGIHQLPSKMYKIELNKLLELKEEMMNKERTPSCCNYYSKKCWRHYLKDVNMFEFSASKVNPTASFELKWRLVSLPLPEDVEMTEMDEFWC